MREKHWKVLQGLNVQDLQIHTLLHTGNSAENMMYNKQFIETFVSNT